MVFQGGKTRQAKHIAGIVNKCIKENNITNYYEPFVGGANIIQQINCNNLFANDLDEELIAFYQYIKEGGLPVDFVSKEQYNDAKNNPQKYDAWYRGNIKYMASFGGKPWGGYSGIDKRCGYTKYEGSVKNFKKQIPKLQEINFTCGDYNNINFKPNSMIVCDPPYRNTTQYGKIKFDSNKFDNWFREVSKEHFVILCEYTAPTDFTCFKKINVAKCLSANDNQSRTVDGLWYCDGKFKDWYENKE